MKFTILKYANRVLSLISNRIWKNFKRLVLRDEFELAIKSYVHFHKDNQILYEHELNPDSIVVDLGGYLGEFTEEIYRRYSCKIYLFEPVKEYYDICIKKFAHLNKIKCLNYAVGKSGSVYVNNEGNSTSVYKSNSNSNRELINSKSILETLQELGIRNIDLIKLNVEGSEFVIMQDLLDLGDEIIVSKFLIQFHNFIDGSSEMRNEIRKKLELTYNEVFNYPFVWEYWIRK